jgi:AraC-like DNA-binding protein
MKPFYQKLVPPGNASILYIDEEIPHFVVPWHFHPEIEILYVLKSTGTRYVGDNISDFSPGEICLIGKNLPHWWKNHPNIISNNTELNTRSLIIQFREEVFKSGLSYLPELDGIIDLLTNSQRGISFYGNSQEKIAKQIKTVFSKTDLKQFTELIILLDMMAKSPEKIYLSSIGYSKIINTSDFQRFNTVHEYVIKNFEKTITLEEIANLISMSPTAFCRYFKKRTGKTFFTFLNEFRIGHACKLLAENNLSVSGACMESGFNNISHFNNLFKSIVKLTPTEYQKAYRK